MNDEELMKKKMPKPMFMCRSCDEERRRDEPDRETHGAADNLCWAEGGEKESAPGWYCGSCIEFWQMKSGVSLAKFIEVHNTLLLKELLTQGSN